jgi:predicted nuclease of predicted toxin-antitoxin system
MRFLIDANMPRSTAELLRRCGHEALDVREIGMGGAADNQIAAYAQQNRLVLVTRDFDRDSGFLIYEIFTCFRYDTVPIIQ